MTGFLEKSPGERSMMRLALLLIIVIAGIVIVWSMFLLHRLINALIDGRLESASVIGTVTLLIAGALTTIFGGSGVKALQQRRESNGSGGSGHQT